MTFTQKLNWEKAVTNKAREMYLTACREKQPQHVIDELYSQYCIDGEAKRYLQVRALCKKSHMSPDHVLWERAMGLH